jgi:hypothetical protein
MDRNTDVVDLTEESDEVNQFYDVLIEAIDLGIIQCQSRIDQLLGQEEYEEVDYEENDDFDLTEIVYDDSVSEFAIPDAMEILEDEVEISDDEDCLIVDEYVIILDD